MNQKICHQGKIISQLHRIEGQIRAIEKMYQNQRDVEELVRVVLAARASLDSVCQLLVTDKIQGCYGQKSALKKQELLKLIKILFKIT